MFDIQNKPSANAHMQCDAITGGCCAVYNTKRCGHKYASSAYASSKEQTSNKKHK